MKEFFKMFFASFLAMVVAGVVVIGLIIGAIVGLATKAASSASSKETTAIKENSMLMLDLGQVFHEQGEDNSIPMLASGNAAGAGVYEITKALEAAAADSKIKGLYLKLSPSPNSWATMQQIREAVLAFKKTSGKFVYAYGESISQGALFVASAADSIFLNPAGDIELKGLASSIPFFKNTLSILEIEPVIFYAGKFKSATEPFRADKMSEPNRLQVTAMQAGIWNEFTQAIATHSHSDTATVNTLTRTGAIQFPEDAVTHHLIEGVRYWDEVENMMKQKLGVKDDKDITFAAIDEYANSGALSTDAKDDRIAVIFAEGEIQDGTSGNDYQIASEDIIKTIRSVRNNDKIKAVVLRVNSPGGSARASEIILRELNLLHKKKPLVVSMGDVAASGGYYISCQADSIFAMPTTITGSIGVFSMMFNAQKLMNNKLGITVDQVKNAPYADFPTTTRTMTVEEAAMMQRGVDSIYALFKRRVATGRRMTEADVDSFAQGRVWTGTDALQIGLVDGLGNMERAVRSAASLAKLKDFQLKTYPEKVDKLKSIMKMVSRNASMTEAVTKSLKQQLGVDLNDALQLRRLQQMNGRSMMLMPFQITTR